jgi:hypothetical protein
VRSSQTRLGNFLCHVWGGCGVQSPQGARRRITLDCRSCEMVPKQTDLIYLPHLDYNLQRYGPWDVSTKLWNPLSSLTCAQLTTLFI